MDTKLTMPTIFQDRLNGDPSYNYFKKHCEIFLDKAFKELKEGRDVKPQTVMSDEVDRGYVVKCCIYTELLGEVFLHEKETNSS